MCRNNKTEGLIHEESHRFKITALFVTLIDIYIPIRFRLSRLLIDDVLHIVDT